MNKIIITKDPVHFSGHQGLLPKSLISVLEESRIAELKLMRQQHEDLHEYCDEPAPWQRLDNDQFIAEFTWFKDKEPEIIDDDYQPLKGYQLSNINVTAKLIFVQKAYIKRQQLALGTRLILKAIQVSKNEQTIEKHMQDLI